MSKSTTAEIEQRIGSEIDHFVYQVPKKNHDALVQPNQQFGGVIKKYGVPHLVFQLNSTEPLTEAITNVAKTISASEDDRVWTELIFYRDRKHKNEVAANMRNDEKMGQLRQCSIELQSSRTGFMKGEISRIRV